MAEKTEAVTPAEDVRNDVAAAIAQLKGPDPESPVTGDPPEVPSDVAPLETVSAPEVEAKADHPSDPARYADGTFKSKSTEAAPEVKAAPELKSPPLDTAKASTAQPSTAVGAPPVSWAADAKSTWNALPPAVQQAVLKREGEVSNGFKQKSEEVRRYESAISPIAQEAQRLGMSVEQGINSLLSAHARLQQDPAGFIVAVAQKAGIDLAALAQNPPAPQPQRVEQAVPYDPRVSQLETRLNDFLSNQTLGVVDSFAAAPGHEHYAAVENDLVNLIPMVRQAEPGLSPTEILQKAYDRAIWMNPDVRTKIIEAQNAKAEADRVAAIRTKQAAAQKAAVSTKGSSSGAMPPPKQANGSGDVYDDVRAAIHSLRQ